MRLGLALLASAALCVTPVVAQGKSKAVHSVEILRLCEGFTGGAALTPEAGAELGWDIYAEISESPYVTMHTGYKDIAGLGKADMYALTETYPGVTLSYCRVDIAEPTGDAKPQVEAIAGLAEYSGTTKTTDDGAFGSFTGKDNPDRLLLVHHSKQSFVLQLTDITRRAASAQ